MKYLLEHVAKETKLKVLKGMYLKIYESIPIFGNQCDHHPSRGLNLKYFRQTDQLFISAKTGTCSIAVKLSTSGYPRYSESLQNTMMFQNYTHSMFVLQ